MTTLTREAILELSVSERIQLIEAIWDTLAETPDQIPFTVHQKAEVERRLADYHANPADALTLQDVRSLLKNT